MSHITRTTTWGIIDVDMEEGRIFFQQRWHYHWKKQGTPVPSDWTMSEKRGFHNDVDRQIWDTWSNKIVLGVMGNSRFVQKFRTTGLTINFDIRWVLTSADYEVDAIKVPPGTPAGDEKAHTRSAVDFGTRTIRLYANDLRPRGAIQLGPNAVARTRFRMPPHEFGHTIQDADEYTTSSAWRGDPDSIMNIGRQLRSRHLKAVLDELNQMIPGCILSVMSIVM